MSKSYHKIIRCHNCCGSNTKYYKIKRRIYRRKANYQLHVNLDDFVHPEKLSKFKDYWREPTDGSWLLDWSYIKSKGFQSDPSEYVLKLSRKLKPQSNKA